MKGWLKVKTLNCYHRRFPSPQSGVAKLRIQSRAAVKPLSKIPAYAFVPSFSLCRSLAFCDAELNAGKRKDNVIGLF
jgi:hypothetical protein